jgi:hypothetical protein
MRIQQGCHWVKEHAAGGLATASVLASDWGRRLEPPTWWGRGGYSVLHLERTAPVSAGCRAQSRFPTAKQLSEQQTLAATSGIEELALRRGTKAGQGKPFGALMASCDRPQPAALHCALLVRAEVERK